MNETHIKLAIEIYNRENNLFIPAEISNLDMAAGNEHEPEAIRLYDELYKTKFYPEYLKNREVLGRFEKSNKYLTGTRDFGDNVETLDEKISTDKNVFDAKKFIPLETDYVIQQNCYAEIYGTETLWLVNTLMNATTEQIRKMVNNKVYATDMNSDQQTVYEEFLYTSYNYDLLSLEKRISKRPVPRIEGFSKIVETRVEVMNEWIEKNKHLL